MTVGGGIRLRAERRSRTNSPPARDEPEQVVVRLRRSGRHLVWPALVFIAACFATGYWWGRLHPAWLNTALPIAAGAAVLLLTVLPLVRWLNRVTIITNRRLIETRGFVVRHRTELLLGTASEARLRRGPLQLLAGSGDIVVLSAVDGRMVLRDMPRARLVHRVVAEFVGR